MVLESIASNYNSFPPFSYLFVLQIRAAVWSSHLYISKLNLPEYQFIFVCELLFIICNIHSIIFSFKI